MPKLIHDKLAPPTTLPHHEDWRRNPFKAIFGALLVSSSLFILFTLLTNVAVNYSELVRGSNSLLFPVINVFAFGLWFFMAHYLLHKLGWQSPSIALFALLTGVVVASYNITELGQTLVTYPVGIFVGGCILLVYYFLFSSRTILWIGLPFILLVIVGYQINQRTLENTTTQTMAAENLASVFPFPIFFTDALPTKNYLVQHFFWDTSRENIRFVTKGNIAINENYVTDPQQSPPIKCGISVCVDLGAMPTGQHIYTDKDNQYFVEYYVMFDRTLIRLSSSKTKPVTKEEAIAYLQQFKEMTPEVLLKHFDYDYLLANSYYFIPRQIFNKYRADFSVIGETNF